MNRIALGLILSAILLLSACGGGGGSSIQPQANDNSQTVNPPPAEDNTTDDVSPLEDRCIVENNSIELIHSEDCVISEEIFDQYNLESVSFLSVGSEILCDDGVLRGESLSVGGLDINGLAISCGGLDRLPASFELTAVTNVAPNTLVRSETITIGDIATSISVSISNGEVSVDGGTFSARDVIVENGQTLQFQTTSSALPLGEQMVSISAGEFETTFLVTTRDSDEPASVELIFPIGAVVSEDATAVFRGTASNGTKITSLTINGTEAETESDYLQWIAEVNLESGINNFELTYTTTSGLNETVALDTVIDYQSSDLSNFSNVWKNIKSLKTTDGINTVFDQREGAILSLNIANGETNTIFKDSSLSGFSSATFSLRENIAVLHSDDTGFSILDIETGLITHLANRLENLLSHNFLLDFELIDMGKTIIYGMSNSMVVSLDIASGQQSVLSESSASEDVNIERPEQLVYSTERNSIIVIDSNGQQIVEIANNTKTVLVNRVRDGLPDGILSFVSGANLLENDTKLFISSLIGYSFINLDNRIADRTLIDSSVDFFCSFGIETIIDEHAQIVFDAIRGDGNQPHSNVCITDLVTGEELRLMPTQ